MRTENITADSSFAMLTLSMYFECSHFFLQSTNAGEKRPIDSNTNGKKPVS